ncbi:hypothetical protein CEUSTIGMA_g8125.t1 [Chlamydomonas eustigma]|uniref:Kinesin motor domain-containing protein n=1 Tax=Chlamydomonas eustigma TaxID=1157962 RepID=A0A250XD58_9CHLO|nr:hypothetical protein CEUSTIGMA_g8125.t1 [Chlamydomonas eustigma]|eukprot:GAX80690.1 hypothetical protein CEUSTIGMA_g8125.t1 [Chlamydomonas eustigma]
MAPSFKKPLEYDPSLAEKTLQRSFHKNEDAKERKKMHMLAELGLADEALDVDDDDEGYDDEFGSEDPDEEGETPIFSNNGATARPVPELKQSLAAYSFKDVFGKDFLKRRQQQISVKGYERYLSDLLARSGDSLQVLRTEHGLKDLSIAGVIDELMHELMEMNQCVAVIGELMHELMEMNQELKQVKVQLHESQQQHTLAAVAAAAAAAADPVSPSSPEPSEVSVRSPSSNTTTRLVSSAAVAADGIMSSEMQELRMQVASLRGALLEVQSGLEASRAAELKQTQRAAELQAELLKAQQTSTSLRSAAVTDGLSAPLPTTNSARLSAASASQVSGGVESWAEEEAERLRQCLVTSDVRLAAALAQVAELQAEKADASALSSRDTSSEVELEAGGKGIVGMAGAAAHESGRDSAAVGEMVGSGGRGRNTADLEQRVIELERSREEYAQRAEVLQARVKEAEAEVSLKEKEFIEKLQQMSEASDSEQARAVQKQMWVLSEQYARKVEELQTEIRQKEVQLSQVQGVNAGASERIKQAKADAAREVLSKVQAMNREIDALHAAREGIAAELISMKKDIFNDKTMQQMTRMVRDKEIQSLRKVKSDSKAQIEAAEAKAREAAEEVEDVKLRCQDQLRVAQIESQAMIKLLTEKWRTEFDKRKKLHNQVLELKGSIRVLCRVRPMLEKEKVAAGGNTESPVKVTSEEALRLTLSESKGGKDFEFDRVFAPTDGQDKVFDEVSALVVSVLDGFNVCIMAYGQTGSGKTFTMEGPESDPGVNSRALRELFSVAKERSDNFTYSFKASILEIYNEQIFDLLLSGKEQDDKLDIKQGSDGCMHVPGLKVESVSSTVEVEALIGRGKSNRSTFATNMNEHSSRSHLVLSVYITAVAKAGGTTFKGKLHLIDLAGSERLSKTGAQGDRLKEAQNINKSLSALGDVIQALQQREKHIPYRNSKLTRLLEDSLGSSSKCVMVVNVSPATENVPETKCSLEFASRARKVDLGKAKASIESSSSGNCLSSMVGGGTAPSGGSTSVTPKQGTSTRASPVTTPGSMSRSSSNGNGMSRMAVPPRAPPT